jgi:sterol 24-C-methyltransferase
LQLKAAAVGVYKLFNLPQEDIDKCVEAYQYLQKGTTDLAGAGTNSVEETEHIRRYYKVLQPLLSIADIEKMYIPPQIDAKKGLYENQLIHEKQVIDQLGDVGPKSHLLDIGCGAGRIAHYAATLTGGKVSGFNIDVDQITNAKAYASETGMDHRLDFKIGDHHNRFAYPDESFDGSYSFQALWPFIKLDQLDAVSAEIFRVLKPGAIYGCGEYLLTPDFDTSNKHHMDLHKLFMPTLAATQSNYPADVTAALERAGFKVVLSAPSVAPTWPLTDAKTDLFLLFRSVVVKLNNFGILPDWTETLVSNLLLGGQAWAEAEKAKIADLNWQIFVQKPLK